MCQLRVPNAEVGYFYTAVVKNWLAKKWGTKGYQEFVTCLREGKVAELEAKLQELLLQTVSHHDVSKSSEESIYHGMLLAFVTGLSQSHKVSSNREAGHGRYDIALIPETPMELGIIESNSRLPQPKIIWQKLQPAPFGNQKPSVCSRTRSPRRKPQGAHGGRLLRQRAKNCGRRGSCVSLPLHVTKLCLATGSTRANYPSCRTFQKTIRAPDLLWQVKSSSLRATLTRETTTPNVFVNQFIWWSGIVRLEDLSSAPSSRWADWESIG